MRAVLPVEPEGAYLRLCDQDAESAVCEGEERFLLRVVRVRSAHLHRVGDQLRKQVAFVVEVAPNHGRSVVVDHLGCHLAPLP